MSTLAGNALLITLGFAPSIVWLIYFYRRDCHPEPKYLIGKTFLMGIIVSPIAVFLQFEFTQLKNYLPISIFDSGTYWFFIWAAFVEEVIKFYTVRVVALKNPEFNEPVDAMIYMITAALGFAAIENILVMFNVFSSDGTGAALNILALRFTGATLLHALSSALVGYFLAMSWFFQHHRKKLVIIGLALATVFHFTFNAFLAAFGLEIMGLAMATVLLIVMALMISVLFERVKERNAAVATLT